MRKEVVNNSHSKNISKDSLYNVNTPCKVIDHERKEMANPDAFNFISRK